jgi:hypothetical protein
VETTGIEPAASCLQNRRSTWLSYAPKLPCSHEFRDAVYRCFGIALDLPDLLIPYSPSRNVVVPPNARRLLSDSIPLSDAAAPIIVNDDPPYLFADLCDAAIQGRELRRESGAGTADQHISEYGPSGSCSGNIGVLRTATAAALT